jgi:2-polyprenyl-3-methyl-5-hydroxy-6-metoxy-1,4-benzoquinol methylase
MNDNQHYIRTKDYSVSQESFDLIYISEKDVLQTVPQPLTDNIASYYESDDYISHTDSKRNWFEKLYQGVKSFSIKRKLKLIEKRTSKKGVLLDYGCGTGDFLAYAKKSGWCTFGFEPNSKAKENAKEKGIEIIDSLKQLDDNRFDVISLWHVLEHVYHPEASIAEFKRILKPEGVLIIAVPNYKSFDANHYKEFWAAYDVPRHLWHFSKSSIQQLASSQNMYVKKIVPMWFDSFYVSLLSEKYKTGKLNVFTAFWIGLKSNLLGIRSKEFSSHIYILKNK